MGTASFQFNLNNHLEVGIRFRIMVNWQMLSVLKGDSLFLAEQLWEISSSFENYGFIFYLHLRMCYCSPLCTICAPRSSREQQYS